MPALRVLVVDDNDLVLHVLEDFMRQRGDYCAAASNAADALLLMEDRIFDVLLSDMVMPGMDGLELIRRAKALQPAIVCILMSGLGTRRDIISALQIGVFDFMDKPVPDLASFNMIVDRAGEKSRLIRDRDTLLENLKQQNAKLEFSLQRLHEAFGQLRQQEEDLESDLLRAQQVQKRFLPTMFPIVPGLEFFAYFGPCEQVGGDFFGTALLPDGRVIVFLLDVAGHGVSAAIVTVTMRELMRARQRQDLSGELFAHPDQVMAFLNRAVIEEEFEPPVLVTMVYAILDPQSGVVELASAGHPAPLHVTGVGEARLVSEHGPVLGAEVSSEYTTTKLQLSLGDVLVLYSDGLTETRDSSGTDFSSERLRQLAAAYHGEPVAKLGKAVEDARTAFLEGAAPFDDMTFIIMRRGDPSVILPSSCEPSIKFVMPERLRAASPNAHGRIKAAWYQKQCITTFTGVISWQQAPLMRDIIRQAREGQATSVDVDLAGCEGMDSTMLGLMLQLSGEVVLHQPGSRVIQQLHEMSVLDRFTISHEICPHGDSAMVLTPVRGREACSEIILSAHEALMEASADNRLRFQDVVGTMRQERDDAKRHGQKETDKRENIS